MTAQKSTFLIGYELFVMNLKTDSGVRRCKNKASEQEAKEGLRAHLMKTVSPTPDHIIFTSCVNETKQMETIDIISLIKKVVPARKKELAPVKKKRSWFRWRKRIDQVAALVLLCMMVSCGPSREEIDAQQAQEPSGEEKITSEAEYYGKPVINVNKRAYGDTLYSYSKTSLNSSNNHLELRTYDIDGCEWLGDIGCDGDKFTHKGSCKYCAARQRALIIETIELYRRSMETKE